MQLRNHPALRYRGTSAWPPDFGRSIERDTMRSIAEHATLASVDYREDPPERRLSVTAAFQGQTLSGTVHVDDEPLLPFLARHLRRFIGRPIGEIGAALDVDVQFDVLKTMIRGRLLAGRLPRTMSAAGPLTAGQPLSKAMRLGPAQGQRCAACDEPILTRQQRPFYLSDHGTVVLDELCERFWLEER